MHRIVQARRKLEELRASGPKPAPEIKIETEIKKPEFKIEESERLKLEAEEEIRKIIEKKPEIPEAEIIKPLPILPEEKPEILFKPKLEPIIRTMHQDIAELKPKTTEPLKPITPPIAVPLPQRFSPAKTPQVLPKNFFKIIFAGLIAVLFLALIGGSVGWYFKYQPALPRIKKLEAPESFIRSEKNTVIELATLNEKTIRQAVQNETVSLEKNTFKEIYFKKSFAEQFCRFGKCVNVSREKFIASKDFFQALEIRAPESFFESLEPEFNILIFNQNDQPRRGLIFQSRDLEKTRFALETWPDIINDLAFLFEGIPIGIEAKAQPFKDGLYQNISFRSIDLGGFNSSFDYFFFPAKNIVILSSSGDLTRELINRLLGQPEIIPSIIEIIPEQTIPSPKPIFP